jgi:hypothetical protein
MFDPESETAAAIESRRVEQELRWLRRAIAVGQSRSAVIASPFSQRYAFWHEMATDTEPRPRSQS